LTHLCNLTNSWTQKADLLQGRWSFGTAVGKNGLIYVAGGQGPGQLASAERYDPVSNNWESIAPVPVALDATTMASLPDGRVMLVTGFDGSQFRDVAYIYDPNTNKWTAAMHAPTARHAARAVLAGNGRVYVVGGQNGSGVLPTVDEYDPVKNSWVTRTPMLSARYAPAVAADGGLVFAFGGAGVSDSAEAYNPLNDTWRPRAAMPSNRSDFSATRVTNNWILAIGGTAAGGDTTAVEDYTVSRAIPGDSAYRPRCRRAPPPLARA
jgi:N-acetylneuraminic acid mutarotase